MKTVTRGLLGAASLALIGYTLYVIIWPLRWRLLLVWFVVEALFAVCVYLPRYDKFNKQPQQHEPPGHDAMRCWRRFLRYATQARQQMQDAGLGDVPSQMVDQLQAAWGTSFEPGYNPGISFFGHLWEPLNASWRPLAFYVLTEGAGHGGCALLRRWGFSRHQHSLHPAPGWSHPSEMDGFVAWPCLGYCRTWAPRTSQLLSAGTCPLQQVLSMTGLEAASPGLPVLFLHGVGGLPAYLALVLQMVAAQHPIIAVEFKGVSMRLGKVMTADEVAAAVVGMLDELGVQQACVLAHSYGTFIASLLVRRHPQRVASLYLLDPVCIGMFMPYLLTNFLYRRFEWKGWSKAAWPEDLPPGSVVLLSGKDDLMDSGAVRGMLERAGHVQVIFNPDLTHGAFLLVPEVKAAILGQLKQLLASSGNAVAGLGHGLSLLLLSHTHTLPGLKHPVAAAHSSGTGPVAAQGGRQQLSTLASVASGLRGSRKDR
ncbi:Alpha/Beta hydrolase protein [Scenedesmus sp. NREL 46B-D3]|nr:Alpha/Beta hydrolase protein [Scenedesmus sp. NREL 46B-D3]